MYKVTFESVDDVLQYYLDGNKLPPAIQEPCRFVRKASEILQYVDVNSYAWVLNIWQDTYSENSGHQLGVISVKPDQGLDSILSTFTDGHGRRKQDPPSLDSWREAMSQFYLFTKAAKVLQLRSDRHDSKSS